MKRGLIIVTIVVAVCAICSATILLCGGYIPCGADVATSAEQRASLSQGGEATNQRINQISVNGLIWGEKYSVSRAKEILDLPDIKVSGPKSSNASRPGTHLLYAGEDVVLLEDYIFRYAHIKSKRLWFGNPRIRVGADIKLLDRYLEGESIDVKQQAGNNIGFRYWQPDHKELKDYAVKFFYNAKGRITKIVVSANVVASMASSEVGVCSGNRILLLGQDYPSIEAISRIMDAPLTRVEEPQKGDEFLAYELYFGEDHVTWLDGFVPYITIKSPRYKVPNCFGVRVGDNISKLANIGGRLSDHKYSGDYEYVGAKYWQSSDDSSYFCEIYFQYDSDNIIREIHLTFDFI
ncbi:MAG: hypothetical protein IJ348_03815 [Alistipes sp.]|nr:hypothetical protein [Alistipes sp.]